MSKRVFIIIILGLLILAGCADTGHRSTDPQAAQSFFPTFANYTVQGTENTQDSIAAILGGAGLMTGNPVQILLVERLDTLLDCYRDRGAFDARIYTSNIQLDSLGVPIAGVLAVINRDRIAADFGSCITRSPLSAQGVEPEPCTGYGSFTYQDDTIDYAYGASDQPLCNLFQAHFNTFEN